MRYSEMTPAQQLEASTAYAQGWTDRKMGSTWPAPQRSALRTAFYLAGWRDAEVALRTAFYLAGWRDAEVDLAWALR